MFWKYPKILLIKPCGHLVKALLLFLLLNYKFIYSGISSCEYLFTWKASNSLPVSSRIISLSSSPNSSTKPKTFLPQEPSLERTYTGGFPVYQEWGQMGKLGKSVCKSIYQISTCHFPMPAKYNEFKRITYQYHIWVLHVKRRTFFELQNFCFSGHWIIDIVFRDKLFTIPHETIKCISCILDNTSQCNGFSCGILLFWFTRECWYDLAK